MTAMAMQKPQPTFPIMASTMEPPPVQYLRTPDGYDIAYTLMGDGMPLVLMPTPFGHLNNDWRWWKRDLLEALASRYRVLHYNSRGHGMASRDVDESFAIEDYVQDLEAVVDRAGFDRFAMFGHPLFNYVAVLYALKHPERLSALLLQGVETGRPWQHVEAWEELARENWPAFLHAFGASANVIPNREPWQVAAASMGLNQGHFLNIVRASKHSRPLCDIAGELRVPTLIVQHADVPGALDAAKRPATVIQGSRLVAFECYGEYLLGSAGQPPAVAALLKDFLADIGVEQPAKRPGSMVGELLSPREIEVLKLIAQGRSNQQIANELVLSVRTVERHITNLYAKIGAHGKAEATAYALRSGLA